MTRSLRFLVCLGVFANTFLAVTVVAAITIEDFNTDGDGTRYSIEGRFLEAANNLWTTVPDSTVVPGLPLLAGVDEGALLFDNTSAPSRRVAFHTERRTDGSSLNANGLGLLDAAVNWAEPTLSAGDEIVFVTGDGTFDGQFNTFWRDRLVGQGFSVSAVDDDDDVESADVSLFIVASNTNAGAAAKYKDVAVPLINYHALANDDLALTSDRGDNFDGSTFEIVGEGHPLAAGLSNGPVTLTTGGADTVFNFLVDRGQLLLAPGAELIMKEPDETLNVSPADIPFTNFEGEGYLAGADLDAGPAGLAVQFNPIDSSSVGNPALAISLAARDSGFDENEDFIRVLADAGNTGMFEIVAEILPVGGLLTTPDGTGLKDEFQTFLFGIPSSSDLVLRIEANSTAGGERIGIDNLRLVPEPSGFILVLLALLVGAGFQKRSK